MSLEMESSRNRFFSFWVVVICATLICLAMITESCTVSIERERLRDAAERAGRTK